LEGKAARDYKINDDLGKEEMRDKVTSFHGR
jgi:hypothetical protein